MSRKVTQAQLIRLHLESGHRVTAIDALNFWGCFRLAARIKDLKDEGLNITSRQIKTPGGATISEYWIEGTKDAQLNLL